MKKSSSYTLNKFAISCDWLQLHIKAPENLFEDENAFYYFKRSGQSKVFKEIYTIIETATNLKIATYCTGANEAIMKRNYGILKFENSQLYNREDLRGFVELFLKRLNLRFIGITRFDIAFDFVKFQNNYYPGNFIRDYVNNKIVKVSHSSQPIKGGTIFKNKNTFRKDEMNGGIFVQTESKIEFETLHFGHKTSDINIKLYNKTNELKANPKGYISNLHKINFGELGKIPVWRLEFSLYSMNALFFNDEKEIKFKSLDMLDFDIMYGIFIGLFKKHFQFKIKEKHGQRVSRMKEKYLWFFDFEGLQLNYKRLPPITKDASKTIKSLITNIDNFNKEFRNFDENFSGSAKEVVSKIIEMHDLGQWAKDKYIDFNKSENYLSNIYERMLLDQPPDEVKMRLWFEGKEANEIGKRNKILYDQEQKIKEAREQEYLNNL